MLFSASASPCETLLDTMPQPLTLHAQRSLTAPCNRNDWYGSASGKEKVSLPPNWLLSLEIQSGFEGICGMRTSPRPGEWKWSNGQGGDLFSSGVTACWVICRHPPVSQVAVEGCIHNVTHTGAFCPHYLFMSSAFDLYTAASLLRLSLFSAM